jgi:BirA family biotin operon repressor/biotin-[acetyl-CoA-carboxylase] ligase
LSYAAAVAVCEALAPANPGIKWPNALFVDVKKLAGILIEYSGDFVIVGVGINITSAPCVEKYETTHLSKYAPQNRDMVLNALMKSLDAWLWRDFAAVRARWMDLAVGLHETVTHREQVAEFVGLNDDGALILRRGTEYILVYGDEIT